MQLKDNRMNKMQLKAEKDGFERKLQLKSRKKKKREKKTI